MQDTLIRIGGGAHMRTVCVGSWRCAPTNAPLFESVRQESRRFWSGIIPRCHIHCNMCHPTPKPAGGPFCRQAILFFLRQDYPAKVDLLDDGEDAVKALLPVEHAYSLSTSTYWAFSLAPGIAGAKTPNMGLHRAGKADCALGWTNEL